jgi:signal transduction histidine kinase
MGIPQDEQERIFEEFHRASNAATAKVAGFGLGLAAVRELVDRYGGKLSLESSVGIGTTFSIDFPIANEPAAAKSS